MDFLVFDGDRSVKDRRCAAQGTHARMECGPGGNAQGSGGGRGFQIAGCLALISTGHGAHFAQGIRGLMAAVETYDVAVLVERKNAALVPVKTSEQKVKAGFHHHIPPSWDDRWAGDWGQRRNRWGPSSVFSPRPGLSDCSVLGQADSMALQPLFGGFPVMVKVTAVPWNRGYWKTITRVGVKPRN